MIPEKNKGVFGASLIIAGTCIGGGMLALPSVTAAIGFFPAVLCNIICWIYMTITGWFLAEACLWAKNRSVHVGSLAQDYFGKPGKLLVSFLFLFLYECLLIAYFSGGTPYFSSFVATITKLPEHSIGPISYLLFGLILGVVICFGTKFFDRLNVILMAGLGLSFCALIFKGSSSVQPDHLSYANWSGFLLPFPVLMGAFGFHNIIPTLVSYLNRDPVKVRKSLWLGTLIPLIIYLIWQWLVLGTVQVDILSEANGEGKVPVIESLLKATSSFELKNLAWGFTFFAIITSILGVAFSMVDFLSDMFQRKNDGMNRIAFCLLTILPPLLISANYPNLFVKVFGFAAGFGEAALNGLFPIAIVAIGIYKHKKSPFLPVKGGKSTILILALFTILVMVTEAYLLATSN